MRLTNHQRRTLNTLLAAALVLGQLAGFIAQPRPAAAALSADPNAEIVYIDNNGFIRVLDTQGDPLVQWASPDGNWDNIALLDVNDDGDMEILAMDQQGDTTIRIAVFDPVVATGSIDPAKQINGIPWDILWTITFGGNGEYVVGGNFDPNIPGDEIAVGFRNGSTSFVQIYNANSLDAITQKPSGRDWKLHIQKDYSNRHYTFGVAGQLFLTGGEELILIDSENLETRLDLFRPDQDMLELDSKKTDSDRYKRAAIGQLEKDGEEEFAAILTVERASKTSLRTYDVSSSGEINENEDDAWAFAPQPEIVFLADIRGNGDEELFFLRNYPEGNDGPRLIMRDEWGDDSRQNDDLIEWGLMNEGSRNEFRAGTGGDVDGDGKDEVILLRNDRIRVYGTPENGREGSGNYVDHILNTDNGRDNLLAGDLDRNGFTSGPILLVTGNMVDAVIPAGTISREYTVGVDNVGTPGGVGINAVVPLGGSWAQINPTFGTTPVTFRIRFNATNLEPGEYNTTMTLSSNQTNVQNDNYIVYLNLTVIPPTLEPNPPVLSMFRLPCDTNPCSGTELAERNEPFTTIIRINGSDDLSFRAAILGVPDEGEGAIAATTTAGLAGPITGGAIDDNGHIVLYDDLGNSRTLGSEFVTSAAALSTTLLIDPALTWITSATVDSGIVPADLSMVISPTVLTEEFQREYAVLVLVADTRAGTPSTNVVLVPIQLANIGDIMWVSFLRKE